MALFICPLFNYDQAAAEASLELAASEYIEQTKNLGPISEHLERGIRKIFESGFHSGVSEAREQFQKQARKLPINPIVSIPQDPPKRAV